VHQLMLVTVAVTGSDILMPDDLTSKKVRQAVHGDLQADRSFVGVRCDWFVIGGRWTGMLVGKEDRRRSWPTSTGPRATPDNYLFSRPGGPPADPRQQPEPWQAEEHDAILGVLAGIP
jgi:hypothetical protein